MEKIAFIIGETFIYWSSIIITLAVIAAICLFWSFYLKKSGNVLGAATFVPLAMVSSLYLSRFIHWYCFADGYSSMEAAMSDMSRGGFALMGAFAACILVACLLRLLKIVKNLPEMLDCLALTAAGSVAVGRLACLFNTDDRGMNIEGITGLPLVSAVTNAVSGATEYRLATFMLQAIITGVIFAALWIFFTKGCKKGDLRDGDTCLLFLLTYGAAQIVLDSTRYDSMFMRSNGFISIVQILGLIAMLTPIILFSIRMVKADGFKVRQLLLWVGIVASMGLAAFMEYWVQRHGDQALFSYSVMSTCLVVAIVLTVVIWRTAVRRERVPCCQNSAEASDGMPGKKIGAAILSLFLCVTSLLLSGGLLYTLVFHNSDPGEEETVAVTSLALMDRYDMQMNNTLSDALDGVLSIKRVYWLSDDDQVAPEPDQSKFGTATDASTLGWLLEDAAELLDGQQTYFSTETKLMPNSKITYYLDETILAITWKEVINQVTYTISEVKIAHPSQFRRFLAGGEYGSKIQLTTTEMAASVNAVVASSGDFYKFRNSGIIVYDGELRKISGRYYDTCFIDENSDLQFVYAGEITDSETAKKYIKDNNIRFSLGFGPVLIEDGEIVDINPHYAIGEPSDHYARAGLGQLGELHYVLVAANSEYYPAIPTTFDFAEAGLKMGCDKFYNLDGGQTAVICMNDKLINKVVYGYQRQISDIIYFATAIPDGSQ